MTCNDTRTRGISVSIGAVAALLVAFSGASQAFAVNPYIAGYPDTSTVTKHTWYSARTDFSGTTTSVPRSGALDSVFSSATFATASATDPTDRWMHQQAVHLASSSNTVTAVFQIWNAAGCVENCPGSPPSLGTYGESSTHINYVYTQQAIYSLDVDFYYEAVRNDGGVTQLLREYVKSSDGDPSNYYAVGTKTKTCQGTNYKIKFYHFGVESNTEVTQTWKVKQYNLLYGGGSGFLADLPARTVQYTGATNGSWLTYSACTLRAVGNENYDVANRDSNAEDPSIPKGQVIWKKGTMTPGGTLLWS